MEIDRLPGFVHRPIQVHPFAAYLYIGLVHPPGSADGASEPSPALLEFRRVMLHPPQNGRVRYAYAPFAHHSDQVSITELKAQIPADAQNHDLPIEVPTLEQFFDRYESWHPSIIAECGRVCTRALTMGYSFRPWTSPKVISPGGDIRDYIAATARDAGIDRHIRFGHRILRAAWSSAEAQWTLDAGAPVAGRTRGARDA
jgi:hypothetical protein